MWIGQSTFVTTERDAIDSTGFRSVAGSNPMQYIIFSFAVRQSAQPHLSKGMAWTTGCPPESTRFAL